MIGTPAADMMCLDVLMKTASKVKLAAREICFLKMHALQHTEVLSRWVINNQRHGGTSPLNAHVTDGGGRRSDEDDAFLFARLCKLCVL